MSIISQKSQRVIVIAFFNILKFLFPFKGVTLHHICLIAGPGLSLLLKKKSLLSVREISPLNFTHCLFK